MNVGGGDVKIYNIMGDETKDDDHHNNHYSCLYAGRRRGFGGVSCDRRFRGRPREQWGGLYAKLIKQVGPTFSLRAYGYDYAQLEQEKLIATPKRTLLHEAMNSS